VSSTRVGEDSPLASVALREYALAVCYFAGVSLLVFYPLIRPGYVLSLDMIFAPGPGYVDFLLHAKGPLYYGRLPFLVFLDSLSVLLPGWAIQKVVLLALPLACGLGAYAACGAKIRGDATTRPGRLFAGTVYALNPFVYVRLLAGHWYFLLGYAFLPLAVVAAYRQFDPDSEGDLPRAVAWATVVSAFDPHATVLLAVAGGCLVLALCVREWRSDPRRLPTVGRRFATYVGGCAAANAYWLLPAVAAMSATRLGAISGADLAVFGPRGTIAGNVPLSIAMLYGFWRPGYPTAADLLSSTAAYALFAALAYLAVSGALRRRDRAFAAGVALFTFTGFLLALGASTPVSEPLVGAAFEAIPILRGMRDTQKFVGLLALAYALLGGSGVDHLYRTARRGLRGRTDRPAAPDVRGPSGRRLAAAAVALLVLAVPAAYAAPMFGGFAGQLDTTSYPADWRAADEYLAGDEGSYRVLVLPWHQYVAFSWTDGKVAHPAELFFRRPTLVGHNVEVGGIETRARDPAHRRSRRAIDALDDRRIDASGFAERLAPQGVKYVLLTHDADYRRYAELHRDPAFSVAFRATDVTVFENEAYDPGPPGRWPRAGPPVPRLALAVGAGLSSLTALSFVGLAARRRLAGDRE
jgi:hypothetical protein